MAALGSLAHKASQHQADLEGEPGWCSAGAHQPPNGAAYGPPARLGPASEVLEGPGHPGAISRGGGQRGLTAAIRFLFPFSWFLFFPFPWLWVGASAYPVALGRPCL